MEKFWGLRSESALGSWKSYYCWCLFLLKRDSNTGVVLWILQIFNSNFIYRTRLICLLLSRANNAKKLPFNPQFFWFKFQSFSLNGIVSFLEVSKADVRIFTRYLFTFICTNLFTYIFRYLFYLRYFFVRVRSVQF